MGAFIRFSLQHTTACWRERFEFEREIADTNLMINFFLAIWEQMHCNGACLGIKLFVSNTSNTHNPIG